MTLAALLASESIDRRSAVERLASTPDVPSAPYAVREVLLGDEDAGVRASAAAWLGRFGVPLPCVTSALFDALYDTHPSVRKAACRSLAQVGTHGARGVSTEVAHVAIASVASVLAQLAVAEPIWWVRRAAVFSYTRLARAAAIPTLLVALDDPFWRVRHAAIRALLVLGAKDHASLVEALSTADEASDRARGGLRYLARRLGLPHADLAGPDARPFPEGSLADPDPAVIAARLEHGERASDAELVEYLGDAHEALRQGAARRLHEHGSDRALLAATLWLADPRIPHATATVVGLLDRLGSRAMQLAGTLLASPDERPGGSVWALSYLESRGRGERLEDVVRSSHARSALVRRAATSALGGLLSLPQSDENVRARVCALLVSALEDQDEDVRRLAVHGLVVGGEHGLVQDLPFASSPVLVRRSLVVSASASGNEPLLRAAAIDPDARTRALALAALLESGRLCEAELVAARADDDPWIRGAVLSFDSALHVLVHDPDPTLRRLAFEVAAAGGFALPAARLVARDDDPWLRTRAAERLARSSSDADLALLLEASRDPSLSVRAAAADAARVQQHLASRLAVVAEGEWTDATSAELSSVEVTSPPARAQGSEVGPNGPEIASPRRLGRSGLVVSPLVVSGANEPSVASLFGAFNAGCNLFFWEPGYRSLTTFLRESRRRGGDSLVVSGTYHATERAIRQDVERALRRLERDCLDVFLVFWVRSEARLGGDVPKVLAKLKSEGLVRAAGFSTHDRELATRTLGVAPWDVVMVRHSAAHPGAEERLFARAEETDTGILGFSATSYGRLLRAAPVTPSTEGGPRMVSTSIAPPSAAECYQYTLSQRGVTAVVSAPSGGAELTQNLRVLREPSLPAERLRELRAHGALVRTDAVDFARHVRRFPAVPEALDGALSDAVDGLEEGAPFDDTRDLPGDVRVAADATLS